MEANNIEKYFLNTVLVISIFGVLLILVSNILFYPEDVQSIIIASVILLACFTSYLLKNKLPLVSILIVTTITMAAMVFQRINSPEIKTTLSIVLVVGFLYSVMLKGRLMLIMHATTVIILIVVFALPLDDALTAAITYNVVYFVLVFATAKLKSEYDKAQQKLQENNKELLLSSEEVSSQNEKLHEAQRELSLLNKELEKRVNERTERIQIQNKVLLKYSYTNAHHLRGPVARLLGLATIYKLDKDPDHTFYINELENQAREIDEVIKQIDVDLAKKDFEKLN